MNNGKKVSDIKNGEFTINMTGDYSVVVTDISGAVKSYKLEDLLSDLHSNVVVDNKAPTVNDIEFTGETVHKDVDYYVSDGDIRVAISDSGSGVDPKSIEIGGYNGGIEYTNGELVFHTKELHEGAGTIGIMVKDNLGNELTYEIPYFMFREAPSIMGGSHSEVKIYDKNRKNSYASKPVTVNIVGWNNYKINKIELYKDNKFYSYVDDGKFVVSETGNYSVRVVDLVGNAKVYTMEELFEDLTSSVVVDSEVPKAVIDCGEEPRNGWYLDCTAKITMSDNVSIKNSKVSINGVEIQGNYKDVDEKTRVYTLDLSKVIARNPNGKYTITAEVEDLSGNVYTAASKTVYADFDAPEFKNMHASGKTVEKDGVVYFEGAISVSGETSDIGSGVNSIYLLRDGEIASQGIPEEITKSGEYIIRVVDFTGRTTEVSLADIMGTKSNKFVVDNDAPKIVRESGFTSDLEKEDTLWYKNNPTLVYNVTDSNMDKIEVSVNGKTVVNTISKDGKYSITPDTEDGQVTVAVVATDKMGHVVKDTFKYMKDSTAPGNVEAITDANGVYKDGKMFFKKAPSVRVSAEDNGAGVDKYILSGSKSEENKSGLFKLGTGEYNVSVSDKLGNETNNYSIADLLNWDSNDVVVDGDAPTISVDAPTPQVDKWYNKNVGYTVSLKDNVGIGHVSIKINGTELVAENTETWNDTAKQFYVSTGDVPQSDNGMYQVSVEVEDNAGNKSTWSDTVYVDKTAPTIDRFEFTGNGSVEGAEKNGSNRYGFFFDGEASCTIHVSDGTVSSGLDKVHVVLESTSGSKTEHDIAVKDGVARVSIPANFKGFISAHAVDRVGNVGSVSKPDGVITETGNWHMNSTSIDIKLPDTSYRDTAGVGLYNKDFSASATVGCSMSGIRTMSWGIGSETLGSVSADGNGNLSGDVSAVSARDKNIVLNISKTLSLSGNTNGLKVWVSIVDRTGHTSRTEKTFSIDKDAPVISVSYDKTNGDKYYNTTRTATVVVKERNFDPSAFKVEGTCGTLGSWSNSGDTWTNSITFSEDANYNFRLSCVDRAGNASNVYTSENFVVDKTAPKMMVSWNTTTPSGGDFYNQHRVATVTVVEKNFDPSRMKLEGSGVLSGWSNSGDMHTATVDFDKDGKYSFTLSGADLAGNTMEKYSSGTFEIDATAPELEISGVEDGVSYKKSVGLKVKMFDKNINATESKVFLVGKKNGVIRVNGMITGENGEFSFDSIPMEESYDDIYTLSARVVDLAGNVTTKSVRFSVNRFGSKYSFDSADLLNTYINKPRDIVITETNVDKLDITKARVVVIRDGSEITVDPKYVNINESGGDSDKYTYTYTISKDAFDVDGKYLIQIYSASTVGTDYSSVSTEYSFVLDREKPEIIISGVQSGKTYKDYSRTVTVDVRDKSDVKSIVIKVDGEEIPFNKKNGVYSFTIGEGDASRSIVVEVEDMAGNVSTASVEGFTISTEAVVHAANSDWFKWGVGAVSAFVLALLALIAKSRHDRKKEEEKNAKQYSNIYKTSSSSGIRSTSSDNAEPEELDVDDEKTTESVDEAAATKEGK